MDAYQKLVTENRTRSYFRCHWSCSELKNKNCEGIMYLHKGYELWFCSEEHLQTWKQKYSIEEKKD